MPNVLQNLLGEGTLSASFIPVYARLLEQGRKEEAGRFAGAIFALLIAVAGVLTLIGVALAPVLVSVFAAGFTGPKHDLAVACTRIIFPMTGVLVLSAWALGILNSHCQFFVPYFAPVLWNVAIIATLLLFGGRVSTAELTTMAAWGALVGGGLQFLVQLPWVLRLERSLRIHWDTKSEGVRTAIKNAGPAVMGRGVVQLSGWLDMVIASFLPGAIAVLSYAQTLYLLPDQHVRDGSCGCRAARVGASGGSRHRKIDRPFERGAAAHCVSGSTVRNRIPDSRQCDCRGALSTRQLYALRHYHCSRYVGRIQHWPDCSHRNATPVLGVFCVA